MILALLDGAKTIALVIKNDRGHTPPIVFTSALIFLPSA